MIGEEREAREDLIHQWVAEGKVEHATEMDYEHGYTAVTTYRVSGAVKWWADRGVRHGQFPSEQLIARLALDMLVFQPEPKHVTPQWQHSWGVKLLRRDSAVINLDGCTV